MVLSSNLRPDSGQISQSRDSYGVTECQLSWKGPSIRDPFGRSAPSRLNVTVSLGLTHSGVVARESKQLTERFRSLVLRHQSGIAREGGLDTRCCHFRWSPASEQRAAQELGGRWSRTRPAGSARGLVAVPACPLLPARALPDPPRHGHFPCHPQASDSDT